MIMSFRTLGPGSAVKMSKHVIRNARSYRRQVEEMKYQDERLMTILEAENESEIIERSRQARTNNDHSGIKKIIVAED